MTTSTPDVQKNTPEEYTPSQNEKTFSYRGQLLFNFLKSAYWALVVIVTLTIGNIGVIPNALGHTPLTVLTPSMEPTLKTGDLIWVDSTPVQEYKVGEIITYHPNPNDPTKYTHRIVGKTSAGAYVTKGDNNSVADEAIKHEQIAGKVIAPWTSIIRSQYTIPAWINENRIGLAALLGGLGILGFGFGNKIRNKLIWKKSS